MKKNINYLRTTLILTGLLFLGCETGVDVNKSTTNHKEVKQEEAVLSGIVDKPMNQVISNSSGQKLSIKKIYSSSAQPGYYLQVGFFERYKPNSAFEKKLHNSGLKFTILDKNEDFYVLVGAYKSYNEAHSKIHMVNSRLHKKSFVVHLLRP
ncbi:hypothetical protein MNB_SV-13-625 [hydrothermal vent metagenome]|uniref:SPOR domain-containing protein n=1 Tax=hydrothermal vent metagenome TaxID=652676 RepID=A0A1W1CZ07_9ZZZZ